MNALVIDDERSSLHLFFDKTINIDKDINFIYFVDDLDYIFSFLENHKVDLIILDIRMNTINGFDLAKMILKKYKDINLIFFTGLLVDETDIPLEIKEKVIGILYKPLNEAKLHELLNKALNKETKLVVRMFGSFDCFINDHVVNFTSTKSKELFALLLCLNGKLLTMEHAITLLWPDKELSKAKILYRDAVWRLRSTLNDINFNCVEFKRAALMLNKDNIECDYYDYLVNKISKGPERFLINYDWSIETENYL